MDVEFSPPFSSVDLHKDPKTSFQRLHIAESDFHFRINLSCMLHIADTEIKKRLLNLTEEYMLMRYFERSSKFGLRKAGKVFLAKS